MDHDSTNLDTKKPQRLLNDDDDFSWHLRMLVVIVVIVIGVIFLGVLFCGFIYLRFHP